MTDDFSHETFVIDNPDGSVSLDPYAKLSREQLKDRCGGLCRALTEWQFHAMVAATDGGNTLANVSEPHRSQIASLIAAYGDDDDPSAVTSHNSQQGE